MQPARLTGITKGLEHLVISLNGNLPLVIGRLENLDQKRWEEEMRKSLGNESIPEAFLHPHYFSIPDSHISRIHAFIGKYGLEGITENYLIWDLHSSNGVYVNEEGVESRYLYENDVVSFGKITQGIAFKFNYQK